MIRIKVSIIKLIKFQEIQIQIKIQVLTSKEINGIVVIKIKAILIKKIKIKVIKIKVIKIKVIKKKVIKIKLIKTKTSKSIPDKQTMTTFHKF